MSTVVLYLVAAVALIAFVSVLDKQENSHDHHEAVAMTLLALCGVYLLALALDLVFALW